MHSLAVPSPRRRTTAFAALVALLVLAVALPATAGAAPRFGVQAGDASGFKVVRAVGAKLTRVEVSWAALEPRAAGERDAAAVAQVDATVAAAVARGLKPILFFDRTPCWASSAPKDVRGTCSGPNANRAAVWRYAPANPADAAGIAAFLAQRYGTRLAALQVWNEPDQSNEKYWAGDDKVGRYVALTKAVYPAVKAVAPKLAVIAGSFVGTDGRWLTAMYEAGWKGSYDGIAVQFYDLPLWALKNTRKVERKFGDRAPLWLTEYGYTSCAGSNGRPSFLEDHPCVTRAVQAQNLTDMVSALRRTSWLRAAVLYSLRDESRAYQFGLLTRAGKRKPSYAALRRALRSRRGLRTGSVRLVHRGSRVRVVGNVPGVSVYTLKATGAGLLYRATVRADRLNRLSVLLPAVLGTRGVHATLTSDWSGRTITARG